MEARCWLAVQQVHVEPWNTDAHLGPSHLERNPASARSRPKDFAPDVPLLAPKLLDSPQQLTSFPQTSFPQPASSLARKPRKTTVTKPQVSCFLLYHKASSVLLDGVPQLVVQRSLPNARGRPRR
jgi:hypothetical protein